MMKRFKLSGEAMGVGGLLLITFILYLPVRSAGFVYDDTSYVVRNLGIRKWAPVAIFTEPSRAAAPDSGLAGDAYRPMVTLSYALDHQFWGLSPAYFHIENVLLNLLNALMVWFFLRRLISQPAARLLSLAVFLCHPVQVQSVAWISQRGTLLSSAGMLITLLALAPPGPWPWWKLGIGWLAFGAALFCRETTGGVILALALVDALEAREGKTRAEPAPAHFWMRYAGLVLLTLFYIAVRSYLLPSWSEFEGPRRWRADLALGVMALAFYFGKLLWPTHLRLHYAYPEPRLYLIVGAALVVVGVVVLIWWGLRRYPDLSAAMGWIGVFLIPVLQVIPIRAFAAERYLYFSMIGFAWLVGRLSILLPRLRPALWLGVLIYGAQSARLIPIWKSEETVWAHAVREDSGDGFAHAAYASCVRDPRVAEAHFKMALEGNSPKTIQVAARTNLSWLALQRRDFQAAARWAEEALRMDPQERHALYNLKRARDGLERPSGAGHSPA